MGIACLLQQPPVRYLLYKHGAYHHGDCSSVLAIIGLKVYRISTMKFLVVLALFAVASAEPEAEADPWYYYTHGAASYHPYTYGAAYGYGYPYYQYVLPTVKAAEEKAEEPVVEAKAAEVKPVVYTHPYLYGGIHYPYAYNYAPVAHTVVKPYTYYANSGGAVHIVKKREAEAEPEAEADPNAWYGYGYGYRPYWGYGYRSAYYHPYSYGYRGYYGGYRGYYYGK